MGQKKKTGEKQPKETDKIKKKLERVATLKRRIDLSLIHISEPTRRTQ